MSKANMAIAFCEAIAKDKFPDNWKAMSTLCVDWLASIMEYRNRGTHKYIPTATLNEHFKLPQGAGIYGFVSFDDNSYMLLTCDDGLLEWDCNNLIFRDGKIIVDTPAESVTVESQNRNQETTK